MSDSQDDVFCIEYCHKLVALDHEAAVQQFQKSIACPSNKFLCQEILKSCLSSKNLICILTLITKIPWKVLDSIQIDILDIIMSDIFYDNIVRFLMTTYEGKVFSNDEFDVLVKFYEVIVVNMPVCETTYEKYLTLFKMSYRCLEKFDFKSTRGILLCERMEELIKLLLFKAYYIERNDWHYSYMNLFPSPVDFYENRNLLPNIVKGSYESADHYLDIHFKLLKEDFVCSVREGIEQLQNLKEKNNSLFLYRNVYSSGIYVEKKDIKSKIYHNIIFSEEDQLALGNEDFQVTKKFMTGSLLFFTRNNFTTFVVATVEDNEPELNDSKGSKLIAIKVSVIGNPYQLRTDRHYNMIEPVTFFEPYYQSLRTLQSINPNKFPLIENIVYSNMKPVHAGRILLNKKYENLNSSQVAALETALSEKFAIIQGPPGTGKSHLARAIITTLVSSSSPWNFPILVVCVRNSALDLVLEPLAKDGLNVIRLGRQTKSEVMTEFTLYELMKKFRKERWLSCSSRRLLITKIKEYREVILARENVNSPEAIETAYQGYSSALESLSCLLQYYDARQLINNSVHVIGATTAGAARYQKMLSFIKPRIVIIEEAAEVMEPFLVSSIPEGCEQLILIGDHLQLQPTPAWHTSAVKHKMNISLFERMIKNGMKYQRLTEQHRMRPEIAALISPLIYEDLSNHPSVYGYPDIRGMGKNLYFVDHDVKENYVDEDSSSHLNFYEADFLLALACYLVKQGYDPSEITILTTYAAQHQYIKKSTESRRYLILRGVLTQVVDNYQGEENNIILLSLVRSKSPTVGFLSKMNRMNVALSRAKHGLYIIGNMTTLSSCSEAWKKMKEIFTKQDAIGDKLPLKCQAHEKVTTVSSPQQLLQLKFGGCDLPCRFELKCGHTCNYPCHGLIKLHDEPCRQPCMRKKACNHVCTGLCGEDCALKPCKKKRKFPLSCGHSNIVDCSFDFSKYKCVEPCTRLLPCGRHKCQNLCWEVCGPKPCVTPVSHLFSCGHRETVPCSKIRTHKCMQQCKKSSCGIHRCQKACSQPCGLCPLLVAHVLECGHVAMLSCSYNKCNPETWGVDGPHICMEMVESISSYCNHPYSQPCCEKTEGITFRGRCELGCPQVPNNSCFII